MLKRLLPIIAFAATALMLSVQVPAQSGSCGIQPIKPIPPIGCKDLRAQCNCVKQKDGTLACHWEWVCVK
jgi:hypothetical protein